MGLSLGAMTGLLDLRDTFSGKLDSAAGKLSNFESRMDSSMNRVSKSLDTIGASAQRAGMTLSVALTAPILLVGGLVAKLGIDAAEARNLIDVSFGDMTKSADAWAANLSETLGLNRFETEKTAAVLFTMTTGMGLGRDASFEMSTGLVQLAADMASFRNIGFDEALVKIRSGLVGETEPLKAIGILVDEATVKTYAYSTGIAKQGEELTQQQKVLARYQAILAQTSNDQGDLARTIESPANQLRLMRGRIIEAATAMGVSLLPAISSIIGVAAKLAEGLSWVVSVASKLPAPVLAIGIGFAGLLAAAGPLLFLIGGMAQGVSSLIPLYTMWATRGTAVAASNVAIAVTATPAAAGITAMGLAAGLAAKGILVIGVAMASWQVGKWIGEWTGLTNKFEDLFGVMQGLSIGQIEAGRTARLAAEALKEEETSVEGLVQKGKEAFDVMMQEANAQGAVAKTAGDAAAKQDELAKAIKAKAEALEAVNVKIKNLEVGDSRLTEAQIGLIDSYTKLGLSVSETALKMSVSEEAVAAATKKLAEAKEQLTEASAVAAASAATYTATQRQVGIDAVNAALATQKLTAAIREKTRAEKEAQQSFSFEATSENISGIAKSMGINVEWATRMFRQGHSLSQIIAARNNMGSLETATSTSTAVESPMTPATANTSSATVGRSAGAKSGGDAGMTNIFYVNGTAKETAVQIGDIMTSRVLTTRKLRKA